MGAFRQNPELMVINPKGKGKRPSRARARKKRSPKAEAAHWFLTTGSVDELVANFHKRKRKNSTVPPDGAHPWPFPVGGSNSPARLLRLTKLQLAAEITAAESFEQGYTEAEEREAMRSLLRMGRQTLEEIWFSIIIEPFLAQLPARSRRQWERWHADNLADRPPGWRATPNPKRKRPRGRPGRGARATVQVAGGCTDLAELQEAEAAFREFHGHLPDRVERLGDGQGVLIALGELKEVRYAPRTGHRSDAEWFHKFARGATVASTVDGREIHLIPSRGRPFRVDWSRGIVG